jgi:bacteriorhodopsin
MLMIAVLGSLVFAGWSRWVWWTPAAVFAIAVPLMLMKVGAINSWRSEAGLATYGAPETLLNMLITLVLYYVAYGIGFGAAQLFRDRARP